MLADLSPRASKHSGPKSPGPLRASAPMPLPWHLAFSGIPAHSGAGIPSLWYAMSHSIFPSFNPSERFTDRYGEGSPEQAS